MLSRPEEDAHEIRRLLRTAAQLATAHSVEHEQFILAALEAFLACNPSLRHQLEEKHAAAELAEARSRGKIALA